MKKGILVGILLLILIVPFVFGIPFAPQGDIWLSNIYGIYNGTNISAEYFCNSSGSCLTIAEISAFGDITAVNTNDDYLNGGASTGDVNLSLNEATLNSTIDARDSDTTYTADGDLLYLDGTEFNFNSSKNNNTINSTIISEVDTSFLRNLLDSIYGAIGTVLNTTTSFAGDVSGLYNNLQLGTDVVGDNELNKSQITVSDFTNDANYVSNGSSASLTYLETTDDATIRGDLNVSKAINFNVTYSPPNGDTGEMYWDTTDQTVAVKLNGSDVVLQVGQELHLRAINKEGDLIRNGEVVYISGAQGDTPVVKLARADNPDTAKAFAIATQDVSNNNAGYFTISGLIRGLDTSAYSANDTIYLSATEYGNFTNVRPSFPNYAIELGIVTRSHPNVGTIQLHSPQSDVVESQTFNAAEIYNNLTIYDTIFSSSWSNVTIFSNQVSNFNSTTENVIANQDVYLRNDGDNAQGNYTFNSPRIIVVDNVTSGQENFILEHKWDSPSVAVNDTLYIDMQLYNELNITTEYTRIATKIKDLTNGSEDGSLVFFVKNNGTLEEAAVFNSAEIVMNDAGLNRDFRIEANTEPNAFVVRGSDGNIGLGVANPQARIEALGENAGTPISAWFDAATFGITFLDDQTQTATLTGYAGSSDTQRPLVFLRRSRGTLDSPSAVQDGDYQGSLIASGYDGNSFEQGASINFETDGTVSDGNVPTGVSIETGENFAGRLVRLLINSTGAFNFRNNPLYNISTIESSDWSNVTITESQISDLTHTTDTNETTRFNNLVGTDCTAGDFVTGVANNGVVQCDTPVGSGDITSVQGDVYITNGSDTGAVNLSFNETKLNTTIDARDDDTTYTADETYLNLIGTQFVFNDTKNNETINNLAVTVETDPHSVLANGTRSLTSNWDQGAFNLTNTLSWFLGKINWSNVQNKPANLDIDSTDDLTTSDEPNLNVNSSNYWDNLNTPSDINAGDITDDNTYVTVAGDTMTGNLTINANVSANYLFGNGSFLTGIAAGGDAWSDPVDANIIPDTSNAYDLGNSSRVFKDAYIENRIYGGTDTDTFVSFPSGNTLQIHSGAANWPSIKTADGTVIFNEVGIASFDFRAETDNVQNALFLDSGNNQFDINVTTSLTQRNLTNVGATQYASGGQIWNNGTHLLMGNATNFIAVRVG